MGIISKWGQVCASLAGGPVRSLGLSLDYIVGGRFRGSLMEKQVFGGLTVV